MNIVNTLITIPEFHESGNSCLSLTSAQQELVSAFNNKARRGEIRYEEKECLCGADKFSLVASVDRYGLEQSTVLCTTCGLIQSNPSLTEAFYHSFYASEQYRNLYDGNTTEEKYDHLYAESVEGDIYKSISKYKNITDVKSVLEIGAAGGWNLWPFVKQGVLVKGYDFNEKLVNFGNRKGISLSCGGVDEMKGMYDVIIANHVIEHFTDFFVSIRKLLLHLNEDGLIYVGVPNISNFSKEQLQNAHTYYFTPKTLEHYLAKCGLEMIHCQTVNGIHTAALFKKALELAYERDLQGHYKKMARILKTYNALYYPKKSILKILRTLRIRPTPKVVRHGRSL